MNGRLDKVAMTNRLMQLKRELHYKCEIGEKGKWECIGANEYLNKTFDVLDEYWQEVLGHTNLLQSHNIHVISRCNTTH